MLPENTNSRKDARTLDKLIDGNNNEDSLVDAEALANFPQHVERERYLGVSCITFP